MDSIRNITAFATFLRPLRCCSQTDCLTLTLFSHTHTRVHNSTQHNPPLLHRQVTASSNQPYGERGSSLLFAVVSPASSILAVFMCTRSRGTSVVTTQPHTFPQSDSAVPHPPLVCTGAQIGCHTATLGLGRQVHRPVINWL